MSSGLRTLLLNALNQNVIDHFSYLNRFACFFTNIRNKYVTGYWHMVKGVQGGRFSMKTDKLVLFEC